MDIKKLAVFFGMYLAARILTNVVVAPAAAGIIPKGKDGKPLFTI